MCDPDGCQRWWHGRCLVRRAALEVKCSRDPPDLRSTAKPADGGQLVAGFFPRGRTEQSGKGPRSKKNPSPVARIQTEEEANRLDAEDDKVRLAIVYLLGVGSAAWQTRGITRMCRRIASRMMR